MISVAKIKNYLLNRGAKRNISDLFIVLIIGLMIVILYSFFYPKQPRTSGYVEAKSTAEQAQNNTALSYEEKLEKELTDVLGQISGAGNVKAMIYFDSSSEVVPAYSQNGTSRVTEEKDGNGGDRVTNENSSASNVVTTNEGNGSHPLILKEVRPKISGIIVIAEGASDPNVKYKLYEAVKTVFNIEQYRVNIYAMEKNK